MQEAPDWFGLAKFGAVFVAVFTTIASVAILSPYMKNGLKRWHLLMVSGSHILLIWLSVGGFTLYLWKIYPEIATAGSYLAYIMTWLGLWLITKHRQKGGS